MVEKKTISILLLAIRHVSSMGIYPTPQLPPRLRLHLLHQLEYLDIRLLPQRRQDGVYLVEGEVEGDVVLILHCHYFVL